MAQIPHTTKYTLKYNLMHLHSIYTNNIFYAHNLVQYHMIYQSLESTPKIPTVYVLFDVSHSACCASEEDSTRQLNHLVVVSCQERVFSTWHFKDICSWWMFRACCHGNRTVIGHPPPHTHTHVPIHQTWNHATKREREGRDAHDSRGSHDHTSSQDPLTSSYHMWSGNITWDLVNDTGFLWHPAAWQAQRGAETTVLAVSIG